MDRRETGILITTGGVLAAGCFSLFHFVFPYHLFFKEQIQLFLLTADYFISYFENPAWLAAYLGDFLTQFFYLRGGGATVLSIVLLIEWCLIIQILRAFGLMDRRFLQTTLLSFIPILIACYLHTGLSYPLSMSVSVILVLTISLIYTRIDTKWGALAYGVITLPALYTMAGVAFFLFPVLIICYEISQKKIQLLYWLLLVAIAGFFPFMMKRVYLLTTKQAYLYPLKTLKVSHINLNNEKALALASESYFENRKKVYELTDEYNLSNTLATYYTNIALSEQGELPDRLLNYYQPFSEGLFLQVGPESNWVDIFFSSDVFFHLGDMNMAQHLAMLGMIFSPNRRSSRMVKRLAEINIVNNDSAAARKYLRMLDATLFHRKWALAHEKMLTGNVDDYPWLKAKRLQIPTRDTLRLPSDYPASLNILIESNPGNSYALDYLLCFYLLNKDIRSFGETYDRWHKGKVRPSTLYDEALLIKLSTTKAMQKERAAYAISPELIKDFAEYTRIYEQSGADLKQLRERFGKTYWFYYHFAQMEKQ
ncbi:MAG: DUF6057 family protein [Tannerellaceae bacterium]|nr:DUF6057 family protein [Tannerellaceae bacterium]